jgi:alkyl hydroperoxide reductase subunit AhpF
MSLLSPTDQQTLRDAFAGLKHPVTLLFFTQTLNCETCDEAKRILAELTEISNRISVEEVNLILEKERAATFGIDRTPAIAVLRDQEDTRMRFLGSPSGYDFMSLVDAVLLAGDASEQALKDTSLELVGAVTDKTTIEVFVTPT